MRAGVSRPAFKRYPPLLAVAGFCAVLWHPPRVADAAVVHSGPLQISVSQDTPLELDLNADTQTDILLFNDVLDLGNYQAALVPYPAGRIIATMSGSIIYPTALTGGDLIAPTTVPPDFWSGTLAYGLAAPGAEFLNVTGAYIGFTFPGLIPAGLYHAWVRVDVDNAAGTLQVLDYAYESIPGYGVFAGATGGPGLVGDLDGDGFVGISDLNTILGNWNLSVPTGDFLLGDPTGDGFVGIEDLNTVLGNWNAGTPPPAEVFALVPEPCALSLIGITGFSVLSRRR